MYGIQFVHFVTYLNIIRIKLIFIVVPLRGTCDVHYKPASVYEYMYTNVC